MPLSILEHLGCPAATPWGRALAPPAGVNHQPLTSPAATAAFTPLHRAAPRSFPAPAGPPIAGFQPRPESPPTGKIPGRSLPLSSLPLLPGLGPDFLPGAGKRRAGWSPRGRARSWPRLGGPGAGSGRERPAASAPSESGFQTRARVVAAPGQPRAPCVPDSADRHRLVSVPGLSPLSLSVQPAEWQRPESLRGSRRPRTPAQPPAG